MFQPRQRLKLARGAEGKLQTIIVLIVAMHTRLPTWVIRVSLAMSAACPLFPRSLPNWCAAANVEKGQIGDILGVFRSTRVWF